MRNTLRDLGLIALILTVIILFCSLFYREQFLKEKCQQEHGFYFQGHCLDIIEHNGTIE